MKGKAPRKRDVPCNGHKQVERTPRHCQLSIEPAAPAHWPTISACLIVRNEAHNLPASLASLGDLASEIIVVDTGSTDDTVEVARSLGAQVSHFAWIDDFAAARNESLSHATREWIFWLDADDRLTPQAVAQLKAAAACGAADAYACLVSSRVENGGEEITEHFRLFRNHRCIRFSYAIHEAIWPDLVRLKLDVTQTDIVIQHLGYASPAVSRQKSLRNLAILEREMARHPEQTSLLYYHGQACGLAGDLAGLEADTRAYLQQTGPRPIFDHMRFWAYASLINVVEKRHDLNEMEGLLVQALAEYPHQPYLVAMRGRLHLIGGRPVEALSDLADAHGRLSGPVRGFRPPPAWVELSIADCHRALNQTEQAITWAEMAKEHEPGSTGANWLLARLYVEGNRLAEAEPLLQQWIASATGHEPWTLLAELRYRQGRWHEAAAALQEAQDRGLSEEEATKMSATLQGTHVWQVTRTRTGTPREQNQAQVGGLSLLAQGKPLEAAECFASAVELAPADPDNYRYLAVALQKAGLAEQAVEAWRLARHWTVNAG